MEYEIVQAVWKHMENLGSVVKAKSKTENRGSM